MRLYHYVGPDHIRANVTVKQIGTRIVNVGDLENWLRKTCQEANQEGCIALTFVIDSQASLRVADRSSEHVACAGGGPVLSAGEMFLEVNEDLLRVEAVSNQSTGYCPEPESWPVVAAALDKIGIPHPGEFTQPILFRRCQACGERNIVKDGWYVCGLCNADLPLV